MSKLTVGVLSLSLLIAGLVLVFPTANASGGHDVHWGYCCGVGPDQWGYLDPAYALCATGMSQTPINISTGSLVEDDDLPPVLFNYSKSSDLEVFNNGHSVQANVPAYDGMLTVGGKEYMLLQFHFHTNSENYVDGQDFPLEMHLVHKAADGSLAVIGVFGVVKKKHEELAKIWDNLPQHEGDHMVVADFNLRKLLPKNLRSYRFSGSLTTPPCSEGVSWIVLAKPLKFSFEQVEAFRAIFSGEHFPDGNRRPLLPLNGRKIYTEEDDD